MGALFELGLDEKQITKDAKNLIINKKWLYENYEELRKQYSNYYIAINNNEVIGKNKDLNTLIKDLKEHFRTIDHIVIEYFSSKKFSILTQTICNQ